jgi:hypothetical protein
VVIEIVRCEGMGSALAEVLAEHGVGVCPLPTAGAAD